MGDGAFDTVRCAVLISALALLVLATPAAAHTAEEEQLCMGDAFRLCSADIPDEARITACMIRNKSLLSPGCRALFNDPPPEPVTRQSTRARKPVNLRPKPGIKTRAAAKKPRKPPG